MIEAIVTFSLIGMGLSVWAAAHLARSYYRQRRHHGTPHPESSFLATLFSEGSPPGELPHGHQIQNAAASSPAATVHSHGTAAAKPGGDSAGAGPR